MKAGGGDEVFFIESDEEDKDEEEEREREEGERERHNSHLKRELK